MLLSIYIAFMQKSCNERALRATFLAKIAKITPRKQGQKRPSQGVIEMIRTIEQLINKFYLFFIPICVSSVMIYSIERLA